MIDKFKAERTGRRVANLFNRNIDDCLLDAQCLKREADFQKPSFNVADEHTLSITLGINFIANSVQYKDALENAKRVLANRLFGEALAILDEAMMAVYSGQPEAVFEALGRVKRSLTGTET